MCVPLAFHAAMPAATLPPLHPAPPQHFKIVAVIAEASENTTHVQLKLEDGTGQCSIKVWQTGDDLAWAQTKEKLKCVTAACRSARSRCAMHCHSVFA